MSIVVDEVKPPQTSRDWCDQSPTRPTKDSAYEENMSDIPLARDAETRDIGQANASWTRDALDNLMHKFKRLERGDITTKTRDRLKRGDITTTTRDRLKDVEICERWWGNSRRANTNIPRKSHADSGNTTSHMLHKQYRRHISEHRRGCEETTPWTAKRIKVWVKQHRYRPRSVTHGTMLTSCTKLPLDVPATNFCMGNARLNLSENVARS